MARIGTLSRAEEAATIKTEFVPLVDTEVGEAPLGRIRRLLPELTGAVRAGAEYILANAWEVKGRSIHDVAARVGVSAHALNRLSRRLGYGGYRDFSRALMLELGKILGAAYAIPPPLVEGLNGRRDQSSTLGTLAARVFALELAALQDTVRALSAESFERAVQALASAETVLLVATGAGLGAAEMAVYRLKVLGIRATATGDPSDIVPEIHLLRPGDVVVAVSYHGATQNAIQALEHARKRGLTSICITSVPGSPVTKLAEVQLLVGGRDEAVNFGQFASRVATLTLLEALAAGVAWVRRDVCLPHAQAVTRETQLQVRLDAQQAAGVRPGGGRQPRRARAQDDPTHGRGDRVP